MIPATQRKDGTWRAARRVRTGFYSRSGGSTRYVPPALRNKVGGRSKIGEDGGLADGYSSTRSLGEVAATNGSTRFLRAALFLLTAGPKPSTTANTGVEPSPEQAAKGEGGRPGGDCTSSRNDSSASALRAAARAAREMLGCKDCRLLSNAGCATAGEISGEGKNREEPTIVARGELNDKGSCAGNSEVNDCGYHEQGRRNDDNNSSNTEWWERLRQAEGGWITNEVVRKERSTTAALEMGRGGESWVGLELQLRKSDVRSSDGQAAIVDFLRGRVGPLVAGEKEIHRRGGAGDGDGGLSEGTHPTDTKSSESTTATASAKSLLGGDGRKGEEGEGAGKEFMASDSNSGNPKDNGYESVAMTKNDASPEGYQGDVAHLRRAKGGVVVLAVLVFDSELSKRDRAELHGQAENAGDVSSSSHGVGGGRFLSLSCALGDRAAPVEHELSLEEAELARALFRLAQQEYHSRYECLSHGEIREVVALGGPNAQDHPDLFLLAEKHRKDEQHAGSTVGRVSSRKVHDH